MPDTLTKRGILSRLNPFSPKPQPDTVRSYDSEARIDLAKLLLADAGTAASRRWGRTSADIAATNSAVYAAIRKRSSAVTKPLIKIVRDMPNGEIVELTQHEALKALRRMNAGMTFKQGIALIEQMKLTFGACYLLKRRDGNGAGKTREFAFLDPTCVEIEPHPEMSWVPLRYRIHNPTTGRTTVVSAEHVVPLRHMVDVRNPLRGLGPIAAARVAIDTGYEAQRFNARYFDNGTHPGQIYTIEDASPAEAQRITQMLEVHTKGTDGAWKSIVVDGGLKQAVPSISAKDMEFIQQLNWGLEEVARAFELNPTVLGSGNSTFSNVEAGDTGFWEMIVTQLEFTMDELTEWFLVPEYGEEFRFVVDTSNIPALQGDKKLAAEIDEIHLRTGKVTINELRKRDGQDPVAWGDVPLVNAGVTSLGTPYVAPQVAAPAEPRGMMLEAEYTVVDEVRAKPMSRRAALEMIENGWRARLSKERTAVLKHVNAMDKRALTPDDIGSYDWDWFARYGEQVISEFAIVYEGGLRDAKFASTSALSTHKAAVNFAERRAAELLKLDSSASVAAKTRAAVKDAVAKTLESGGTLRDIKNAIKKLPELDDNRATTIARTETSFANGRASQQAYESRGVRRKQWALGTNPEDDDCTVNAERGAIGIGDAFPSGDMAPPAHPNCTCTLVPVSED